MSQKNFFLKGEKTNRLLRIRRSLRRNNSTILSPQTWTRNGFPLPFSTFPVLPLRYTPGSIRSSRSPLPPWSFAILGTPQIVLVFSCSPSLDSSINIKKKHNKEKMYYMLLQIKKNNVCIKLTTLYTNFYISPCIYLFY